MSTRMKDQRKYIGGIALIILTLIAMVNLSPYIMGAEENKNINIEEELKTDEQDLEDEQVGFRRKRSRCGGCNRTRRDYQLPTRGRVTRHGYI